MPPPEPFLYAGGIATVLIALGWRPWRAEFAPRWGPLASAVLPACAFWLAWLPLHGGTRIPWPPREGMHWVFWAVLVAAAPAAIRALRAPRAEGDAPRERGWIAASALDLVAAQVLAWGALWPLIQNRWSSGRTALWVAGLSVCVVLSAGALRAAVLRRGQGPELAGLALAALVGAALVLAQSSGASAILTGALCTAVGGLWVLGLWRRTIKPLAGAEAPLALTLVGLLLSGHIFASTPAVPALLLLLVPHLSWIPGRSLPHAGLRLVLAAALVALAWWLAVPEPSPYDAYY